MKHFGMIYRGFNMRLIEIRPACFFVAVAMACFCVAANANDIENCRWKDGRAMSAKDCDLFRKLKAEDDAKAAAYRQREAARLDVERHRVEQRKNDAAANVAKESDRAAQLRREHDEEKAQNAKLRDVAMKAQADEREARRRKCGKDFEALRIGMTLDRYEECTEAVDHVTQTVSQSGVTEVYRSTFYLIQARDGRIVSFTRR